MADKIAPDRERPDPKLFPLLAAAPTCVAKVCYEYQNTIQAFFMTKKCLEQTRTFRVRPDDVFIITYPKSGTTWAKHIALLVECEGELSYFEDKHISQIVPFLETIDVHAIKDIDEIRKAKEGFDTLDNLKTSVETANAMPIDTRRILKTHAHPRWIPEELQDDPKAKVVYVARNPKDTAVSYYHFCKFVKDLPDYASWDEYLEEFMADRLPGGSYFEHNLYWWKLRDHPNVLYLTYEDMKQDPRKAVLQFVDFMGKSFSDDIIDRIVEASNFNFMKKNKSMNPDDVSIAQKAMDTSNNKSFMRKGVVGDWKNFFTEDQNRRFDKLVEERFSGSGIKFKYE